MLAPSEILQPQIYADLDPEAIARYLVANGWRCIHEEDGRFVGIRWFRHPLPPQWPNRELVTNRTIPFALSHLHDANALETTVSGGTILRVGAKRYRDYPQMNRHVLLDMEVHENRWIGFIIADIQAMETALRAPRPPFAHRDSLVVDTCSVERRSMVHNDSFGADKPLAC